jgi:hypothetical protein
MLNHLYLSSNVAMSGYQSNIIIFLFLFLYNLDITFSEKKQQTYLTSELINIYIYLLSKDSFFISLSYYNYNNKYTK